MASVEIRSIRKSFESGRKILDDVSFSAKDGQFIALLGASGCGKTTLLRIVAGLEFADSGAVVIDGEDVAARSPKDRDIAMVFQNYALYPHLSVRENIGMGLKLRKFPSAEIEARAREAAAMLGLSELLERKPSALSGGQRQRVALARALVRRPKVFLLDEPLSNLDAVLREKTRGELKVLFKRLNGTVLYVTHDQIEAMTMSDRIVVMDKGKVQQDGTPEDIYHRPANVFVAKFLGSPPMNVFRRGERLVGIRPEDVAVFKEERAGAQRTRVSLAEPTGPSTVLTLELEEGAIRANVAGAWEPGRAEAWIELPADRLHFFDPASGRRL